MLFYAASSAATQFPLCRRMLDAEMAEVCRIYAEIELTDLPGSKGKEAQEWLTDAHGNVKREHERIDMHIRRLEATGEPGVPLQNPKRVYTLKQQCVRRGNAGRCQDAADEGTSLDARQRRNGARDRVLIGDHGVAWYNGPYLAGRLVHPSQAGYR